MQKTKEQIQGQIMNHRLYLGQDYHLIWKVFFLKSKQNIITGIAATKERIPT